MYIKKSITITYLSLDGRWTKPKPSLSFHDQSWNITSAVCHPQSTWMPSRGAPLDLDHYTWSSSHGGWLSAPISWSVACDVKWLPSILISHNTANCWHRPILDCMSQRPRTRGFISPGWCFLSVPQSPFWFFYYICLYFASVSSLNLLNHKKQVTAEAPYAGWLIKVVSVVKTTTNS